MRTFHLHRQIDRHGVSGAGVVAEGVEFSDGTVALRWLGTWRSTAVYDSIEAVTRIHGHASDSVVVFTDGDPPGPTPLTASVADRLAAGRRP